MAPRGWVLAPSSSGGGVAWLQPAFVDRLVILVPATFLSPSLMRDAYGRVLPWLQRPHGLSADVHPPSQKLVAPGLHNGVQALGTPGLLPALLLAVSMFTRAQLC